MRTVMDNKNKKYSVGKYFSILFKSRYNAMMLIIMDTEKKKMD